MNQFSSSEDTEIDATVVVFQLFPHFIYSSEFLTVLSALCMHKGNDRANLADQFAQRIFMRLLTGQSPVRSGVMHKEMLNDKLV